MPSILNSTIRTASSSRSGSADDAFVALLEVDFQPGLNSNRRYRGPLKFALDLEQATC
jgi:hypothetical protein